MSVLLGLLIALIDSPSFSEMQRSGIEFTEAVVVRFSPFCWDACTGRNVESRKSKRSPPRKPERSRSIYRLGSSVRMSVNFSLFYKYL